MQFRYFINESEVFPINAGLEEYNYDKIIESSAIAEKVLTTGLKFNYNDAGFNFKNQEYDNKCEILNFKITQRCNGNTIIYWEGIFSIIEGAFDEKECIYTITPKIKQYLLNDLKVNLFDDPNKVEEGGTIGVYIGTDIYTSARYLDKFLLYIAKKCNPNINSVISNFLRINPTGPFYIPGVTNKWDKMVLLSISDIQSPPPTMFATLEEISFGELMDDLFSIFDLTWRIDNNYNLIIENDIFFEGVVGLDLTQTRYTKYLSDLYNYTYKQSEYFKKETFKIADHNNSVSVIYGGLSNISKNESEKTYNTNVIRTDIVAAFNLNATDGVMLVATDGGALDGKWRAISQEFLSPDYLVKTLHNRNRPSLYGLYVSTTRQPEGTFSVAGPDILSSGGIIFNSIKPTKFQDTIQIPICCDDSFEIENQVNTKIGIGYVEKASLNTSTNLLKLDLKYKIDNCDSFEPNLLTGLDLWLKYGDIIYDSPSPGIITTVNKWNDSSGHNRHAVQNNSINKPQGIPGDPNGKSVIFFDFIDAFTPSNSEHKFLTTPSFQIFPNKRGTIFILFKQVSPSFGPTGPQMNVLSTQDGSTGNFFDYSFVDPSLFLSPPVLSPTDPEGIYSFAEGKYYPKSKLQYVGLQIIRRASDISLDTSTNHIPALNNPMQIANLQPTIKPLIIGTNVNVIGNNGGTMQLAEVIIYNRDLTDEEIEKVELYIVKKGLYTIY